MSENKKIVNPPKPPEPNQNDLLENLQTVFENPSPVYSVGLEIVTNATESLAGSGKVSFTAILPIELGGTATKMTYYLDTKTLSKAWSGLSVFGMVSQIAPEQIESYKKYKGNVPINIIIANVVIDGGISFISYAVGLGTGAITLAASAIETGPGSLPLSVVAGVAGSMATSLALNSYVENSSIRESFATSLIKKNENYLNISPVPPPTGSMPDFYSHY